MTRVRGDLVPPLLVVGAPRSGTTLLYKTLCLHDASAWLSNYHARVPAVPATDLVVRLVRGSARRRATWFDPSSNAYVFGAPRPLRDRVFPTPVEADRVWGRALGDGPGRGVGSPQQVRRVLGGAVRWGGGQVVVAKRIASNRNLGRVLAAVPSTRFVHVVRDGRDVAASLRRVDWWPNERIWWLGRTPADWERDGHDPWELAARHWVQEVSAVRTALRGLDERQVLVLRYEDLVRDPRTVLEQVRDFAGLPADQSWSREVAELEISSRPGARDLPAGPLEVVTGHQRALLDELGYP